MSAVKISVHGELRFTALPVHTTLHLTLTLQERRHDLSDLVKSSHADEMTHMESRGEMTHGCHFRWRGDNPDR